jgi:sugar phosphate isomerase/epimerase
MVPIKQLLLFALAIGLLKGTAQERPTIHFFQTDWGRTSSWDVFCEKTKAAGYDGIEIWLPKEEAQQRELQLALAKHGLKVAFLNGTQKTIPFAESLAAYRSHLEQLCSWSPAFINCHTGSDFFTFEQNRAFIMAAIEISDKNNIPIYHETHRGRFSYSLPQTLRYIQAIPRVKLNLDISHWMVVHESLLYDQEQELAPILENTHHLHARVGHAEAPQVNDPKAPEWKKAVDRHLDIWERIIKKRWATHPIFTVTTEFGPADYMPTLPYTRQPVSDQWGANLYMKQLLKERMHLD